MIGAKRLIKTSSAFVRCLLISYFIGNIPSASAEEGHCIWYGLCSRPGVEMVKYCSYNGSALPINDASVPLMKRYCPELVAGGKACCSHEQLQLLNRALSVPESLLSSCPPCMKNFFKHFCAMVCGPNQTDYLKPVQIVPFNKTHDRVMAIDYHLGKTYKESTFNSCINVPTPTPRTPSTRDSDHTDYRETKKKALDFMCGDLTAENCTADRWFEFLGDARIPYVAFQINFVGDDNPVDGFTPYNPETSRGCDDDANSASGISKDMEKSQQNHTTQPNSEAVSSTSKHQQENWIAKQKELLDACSFLSYCQNSASDKTTLSVNPTALYWSSKLDKLNSTQKIYAEKYINDILLEAELGNLERNSNGIIRVRID